MPEKYSFHNVARDFNLLGNFAYFLSSADFIQNQLFEIPSDCQNFGSISGPTFVRPDLGSNCLQRLSVDNTSMQRVKSASKFAKFSFTTA